MPNREKWLDIARKVDWQYSYVKEEEVFPAEISGRPWLDHAAWAEWNEAYRTTYREYVANQRSKDDSVMGVRSVLSKARLSKELDPGWVQLLKFHYGALALAEYAGAVAELRMARFGRDSAWRTMATLGALDEIRHTQIALLLGHDLLRLDGNFDWTHRAYHTDEWLMIAADTSSTICSWRPTPSTSPCNSTLCSRPASPTSSSWPWPPSPTTPMTTFSRRRSRASRPTSPGTLRSDTPSFASSSTTETKSGLNTWSTRCGGAVGGCSSRSPARPWST